MPERPDVEPLRRANALEALDGLGDVEDEVAAALEEVRRRAQVELEQLARRPLVRERANPREVAARERVVSEHLHDRRDRVGAHAGHEAGDHARISPGPAA